MPFDKTVERAKNIYRKIGKDPIKVHWVLRIAEKISADSFNEPTLDRAIAIYDSIKKDGLDVGAILATERLINNTSNS